ncbi:MAG: multidrug efflux RND transporter permease subunit [Verrucomicrobia bacterium]|nr:multidrug efflux RND transporter permease subunit [Verrucomicrobiota bacterium]
MAKFFIYRPVFAMAMSIVILIMGLVSLTRLPVAQFPNVAPPTVCVTATYPGANARVVEDTVARPIEEQMNGVEGMIYMYSSNTDDGRSVINVVFETGKDLDIAAVDVQNRVSQAQASLPSEVVNQGITITKQSPNILLMGALYADEDKADLYDSVFLNNYAYLNIVTELKRVTGVGDVSLFTAQDYSMRYWLNPDKMAQMGVDASDVYSAVSEQNREAASGQIGYPPALPGTAFSKTVKMKGRLVEEQEFGDVIIRADQDGSMLRAKDLGDVELGSRLYKSSGHYMQRDAALMAVYQLSDANGVATAKLVRQKVAEIEKNFPEGLHFEFAYDSTVFINASVHETIETLFEAFGLVFIVVFVFLGNFRATIIPVIAVPISIVGTFAVFGPLGFGINTMTMFAMVLAIGIVVDDAIVVVEAVELYLSKGKTPLQATLAAMEDVSGAVVGVALVLVSVFIPVAFLGGITGMLYKQFAITLAVSVMLSAFVALSLTPALCAMILRPRKKDSKSPIAIFSRWFDKAFEKTTRGYQALSALLIRRVVICLLLLCGLYFGALKLAMTTPTSFVPSEDQGVIFGVGILPPGSSLERTQAYMAKVEEYLSSLPEVQNVISISGLNLFQTEYSTYYGSVVVTLKNWEERPLPEQKVDRLLQKISKDLSKIPDAVFTAGGAPAISGLGMVDGVQFELQDRNGVDPQDLELVTQDFVEKLSARKDLFSLAYTFYNTQVPEVYVDVDRDKMKKLQVPLDRLYTSLQVYLGSAYVNQFTRFARNFQIYLQAKPEYRMNERDIGNIFVKSDKGDMVPVNTLATIVATNGADSLRHYNMYRTAELQIQTMPGVSSGTAMNTIEQMAQESLPEGFGYEWTGIAYQEKQTTASQQIAVFVLALVFVFLVLSALYESWAVPFSVIFGLPIGVLGAFLGVFMRGMPNDVYFQIGLVMLLGLAAKNAILIVEYAKVRRDKGMDIEEAAIEAAGLRLRPILMTSFAFLFGVLPLVIASGACAASRQSLGTTVFFGMTMASALGIFFIPSLYVYIQKLAEKISPPKKRE